MLLYACGISSFFYVVCDAFLFLDPRVFDFSESATDLLMDRPSHYQHEGDSSSLSGYPTQHTASSSRSSSLCR